MRRVPQLLVVMLIGGILTRCDCGGSCVNLDFGLSPVTRTRGQTCTYGCGSSETCTSDAQPLTCCLTAASGDAGAVCAPTSACVPSPANGPCQTDSDCLPLLECLGGVCTCSECMLFECSGTETDCRCCRGQCQVDNTCVPARDAGLDAAAHDATLPREAGAMGDRAISDLSSASDAEADDAGVPDDASGGDADVGDAAPD